jgi:hypothetical protein
VTNANDIAALVKDLQGEDAHDVDLITVADALQSQARRIAELENCLRHIAVISGDPDADYHVMDSILFSATAALSSGKGDK